MPVLQVLTDVQNTGYLTLLDLIPHLEIQRKLLLLLKKIFNPLKKLLEPSSKACLVKL